MTAVLDDIDTRDSPNSTHGRPRAMIAMAPDERKMPIKQLMTSSSDNFASTETITKHMNQLVLGHWSTSGRSTFPVEGP